jgi:mannitol operon transcriptional antiterminator
MFDYKDYLIMKSMTNETEPFNINQIADRLEVSKRMVYYSVNKILDYVASNHPNAHNITKDATLTITPIVQDFLKSFIDENFSSLYTYSQDERIYMILLYLLLEEDKFSVQSFEAALKISKNTVINDLKIVRYNLAKYHCTLEYSNQHGYFIEGKNLRKRSVLFKVINDLSDRLFILKDLFYDVQDYDKMHELLTHLNRHFDEILSEDMFNYLVLALAILKKYPEKPIQLSDEEKSIFTDEIYRLAYDYLPESLKQESEFIFFHFLDIKDKIVTSKEDPFIYDLVNDIIEEFKRKTLIHFKDESALFNGLYNHISQSLKRYKYGIRIENTMKQLFKQQYYPIFNLTKKVMATFEEVISYPISEDDITYIAMHFGGHLRRENQTVATQKILIVCPTGVATSYLLKKSLEEQLDNIEVIDCIALDDLDAYVKPFDKLIATVKIKNNPYEANTIYVSPLLSEYEKERLSIIFNKTTHLSLDPRTILQDLKPFIKEKNTEDVLKILHKYLMPKTSLSSLSELVLSKHIQKHKSAKDYKEALYMSASPLIHEAKVTESYVKKIIENIDHLGPYIVVSDLIAISHARPEDGVLDNGISALILENPVIFPNDKPVKIIFTLAAVNSEMHLKLLSLLSEKIEQHNETIIKSNSESNLLKMLLST